MITYVTSVIYQRYANNQLINMGVNANLGTTISLRDRYIMWQKTLHKASVEIISVTYSSLTGMNIKHYLHFISTNF